MDGILEWLPIIWTVRITLLILVGGGAYLFVLLIARFSRWTNVRAMVLADPPRVESVGGEFAGAKGEVRLFHLERSGLDHRVATLEEQVARLGAQVDSDERRRKRK